MSDTPQLTREQLDAARIILERRAANLAFLEQDYLRDRRELNALAQHDLAQAGITLSETKLAELLRLDTMRRIDEALAAAETKVNQTEKPNVEPH